MCEKLRFQENINWIVCLHTNLTEQHAIVHFRFLYVNYVYMCMKTTRTSWKQEQNNKPIMVNEQGHNTNTNLSHFNRITATRNGARMNEWRDLNSHVSRMKLRGVVFKVWGGYVYFHRFLAEWARWNELQTSALITMEAQPKILFCALMCVNIWTFESLQMQIVHF